MEIKGEKDLVSLVTCTPFGVNSHRLIVTGHRVDYKEKEYIKIKPQPSFCTGNHSYSISHPICGQYSNNRN